MRTTLEENEKAVYWVNVSEKKREVAQQHGFEVLAGQEAGQFVDFDVREAADVSLLQCVDTKESTFSLGSLPTTLAVEG